MRQILRNRALSVLFFATALLAGCGETAGNTPEHPTTEQITAAETEMATAETETATAAPLVTTETTSASTSAETTHFAALPANGIWTAIRILRISRFSQREHSRHTMLPEMWRIRDTSNMRRKKLAAC